MVDLRNRGRYVLRPAQGWLFALAFVLVALVGGRGDAGVARSEPAQPTVSSAWRAGADNLATAKRQAGATRPVRLKARVASVTFARKSNGRPTFINLGFAYPNPNRLTLLIWGNDRINFPAPPERMFKVGQLVCAQGFVTRYDGVAQIEVALWDAKGRLLSF